MAHNKKKFNKAVSFYKKMLRKRLGKGSTCLVELPLKNEKAFFSIAPLSRAVHELGSDVSVFVTGRESRMLPVLHKCWSLYRLQQKGKKNKGTKALADFIKSVERKTKSKYFAKLFKEPELHLTASGKGFDTGEETLAFQTSWFRKSSWRQLLATAGKILKQGYGIKKSEIMGIGFDLLPTAKDLKMPLSDYLDSYSIAYSFALKARRLCKDVSMGAQTSRKSQLQPLERVTDLAITISGCEYEKKINEPWFKAFRKLSPFIGSGNLTRANASFGIAGQGYGGKHFFGMRIGYPTPNKKSRWQSPGAMFLKPYWYEQTKVDKRPALRRHAITSTLPLPNYIRTCNIDYFALRKRDNEIRKVIKKCVKLFAVGRKLPQGQTKLELDTRHLHSGKSPILVSDIEVNPKTEHEAAKAYKLKAGGG